MSFSVEPVALATEEPTTTAAPTTSTTLAAVASSASTTVGDNGEAPVSDSTTASDVSGPAAVDGPGASDADVGVDGTDSAPAPADSLPVALIGGVVGGVCCLIYVLVAVGLLLAKRRREADDESTELGAALYESSRALTKKTSTAELASASPDPTRAEEAGKSIYASFGDTMVEPAAAGDSICKSFCWGVLKTTILTMAPPQMRDFKAQWSRRLFMMQSCLTLK